MKVGIVGSRRRASLRDQEIVFKIVEKMSWAQQCTGDPSLIVSGGCRTGADRFAEEAAKFYGVPTKIHPIPSGIKDHWEFTKSAWARNYLIARDSDILMCLVSPDRTGGTECTVGYGYDLNRQVFIVDGDGRVYLSSYEMESMKWREEKRRRDSSFTVSDYIGTE